MNGAPFPLMYVAVSKTIDDMADVLLGLDNPDLWGGFSCIEVESIATVLRIVGNDNTADFIIGLHAWADCDEEDQHHDLYLERRKEEGYVDEQGGTS